MNQESWSRLASISEVTSSVAIIVTLLFLVVEIRQNTEAIDAQLASNRAQTRTAIWDQLSRSVDYVVAKPRIAINLGTTEPISHEEQTEVHMLLVSIWGVREFAFFQYKDGVVDQATFESIMDERELLAQPRVSEWWDQYATLMYDPEFVELINTQYRVRD